MNPQLPATVPGDALRRLLAHVAADTRARDADLRGAVLASADLTGLQADDLDLRGADLSGAVLCAARLGTCRLDRAKLAGLDAAGAVLRRCTLDGADAADARLDGAALEDGSAEGADFARARLSGAHLSETSFARAKLADAVLDDAEGEGVSLRGADLTRATLRRAVLPDADFRGADLTGADASGADLQGADFRGAVLAGTCFDGTNLDGARFDAPEEGDAAWPLASAAFAAGTAGRAVGGNAGAGTGTGRAAGPGTAAGERPDAGASGASATAADPVTPDDAGALLNGMLDQLEGLLAAQQVQAEALFAGARHALDALAAESASDRPPEAWQPALAPLVEMMAGQRPLDAGALEAALRAMADGPSDGKRRTAGTGQGSDAGDDAAPRAGLTPAPGVDAGATTGDPVATSPTLTGKETPP